MVVDGGQFQIGPEGELRLKSRFQVSSTKCPRICFKSTSFHENFGVET